MQMSLSICINSIITAMEGGGEIFFYSLRQCYLCQLVWGGQTGRRRGGGSEWVYVDVLLEVREWRGRLLHHLARASCHIAENLTNSIVSLVSHWQTPSDWWCLNATTWPCTDQPASLSVTIWVLHCTQQCVHVSLLLCVLYCPHDTKSRSSSQRATWFFLSS